jgi:1-acyl-sn-glycerol-3-phosphate acyltransferase
MKKNKETKTIYYTDELNDEFSSAKIVPKKIDENYKYIPTNFLWEFCSCLVQNILSMPIKLIYPKIKFSIKYIGKEKLKPYKKQGYFIYVNHTQAFADTLIPSVPIYPKRNFFIVNPENVSMKFSGELVHMLGALPVPANKEATKNFLYAIEKRIKKGNAVTIYPEAHIWPYYTKIRPFKSVSFKYPVKLKVPTFCMTNTYQSYGKNNDKIKIVTYIDGPFFADEKLNLKERQEALRNMVYEKMADRSKNSNFEYIKYEKENI